MTLVVLCLPAGAEYADPDRDLTTSRDVELLARWDGRPAGVVGWSDGGLAAVSIAIEQGDAVDRLVLIASPAPGGSPPPGIERLTAKTLLLFGSADQQTGYRVASWWKQSITNSRIEMVPGGGHDILERVWPRVLAHLAPRAPRRG